ncbi:hypothetical protein KIH77_06105 [Bifidobacterium sp. 82T24]|uniref:hypothetical protein n=1 Tax=Bifidobacterium pluvialisilvae TaxID=2834436 RepID=UPI001C583C92|nr:hypothetical protein [Bifidobacterium pluvialisilvae]MBW3088301.1 hypothetical protein [Bifidobacterium pluvialisilvae]
MGMVWQLLAAGMAGMAAYLHVGGHRAVALARSSCDGGPSVPLLLEMIAVAVRQGASIPRALEVIGGVLCDDDASAAPDDDVLGAHLIAIADALNRGADWGNAWGVVVPDSRHRRALDTIREALAPSWKHGISPLLRIETTIEQIDRDERRSIEENAARLSVRVLVPMGLCFLPAFILIGVVPSIVSFAGG